MTEPSPKLDLIALAERFVATPSVSADGNSAIAKLACELIRKIGLEPRLQTCEIDGAAHYNVIADLAPREPAGAEAAEGLLLLTHLDTVPPGDPAAWTATGRDPFRPTRDGDRLYGLGSADAKLDFLCKLAAIAEVDATKLQRPLRLVGTFAEEIGLRGARHLVESGETRGFRYALVGEPSELACVRAHKSYAVYEAHIPLPELGRGSGTAESEDFAGAAAHSSTPALGRNAIEAALARLDRDDVRGLVAIEGGTHANVVPDHCRLAVALRGSAAGPASGRAVFDPAPLLDFWRAWCARIASAAEVRDSDFDPDHTVSNLGRIRLEDGTAIVTLDLRPIPGLRAPQLLAPLTKATDLRLDRHNPPLSTAADSRLVRAVCEAQVAAGLEPQIATKATCTEAGVLAGAGVEAVIVGPGPSVGNVHRPNEYTRISELFGAVRLYAHAITELCSGERESEKLACSA